MYERKKNQNYFQLITLAQGERVRCGRKRPQPSQLNKLKIVECGESQVKEEAPNV